jgi:uncharacterized protein YegJ (DUF2314 family)
MSEPFELTDAVRQHSAHPDAFWIPDAEERLTVPPGIYVKLVFTVDDGAFGERMWVEVLHNDRGEYVGRLANTPIGIDLPPDTEVRFEARHIIDIDWDDEVTCV